MFMVSIYAETGILHARSPSPIITHAVPSTAVVHSSHTLPCLCPPMYCGSDLPAPDFNGLDGLKETFDPR